MADVKAIIEKFGTSRKAISCGSLLGLAPNMGCETLYGAGLPKKLTARSEKSMPSIEHITGFVASSFSVAGGTRMQAQGGPRDLHRNQKYHGKLAHFLARSELPASPAVMPAAIHGR
jgi:hypothetical protein